LFSLKIKLKISVLVIEVQCFSVSKNANPY
jgi:hypothetical protein